MMPRSVFRRTLARIATLALMAASGVTTAAVLTAAPAHADGPGVGTPYVATLGDSYISGEAGRWAGNTNGSAGTIDALEPTAYLNNATHTAETINRCHRSASAEAYLGGGVAGVNLACSGATTSTVPSDSNGYFKPGIDFYDNGAGKQGQARATSAVAATKAKIATALVNVRTAMRGAGYADGAWTLVVQTYPSPIPASSGFRYSQSGYTRQSTGGCGFWNKDADWAGPTALSTINATVRGAVTSSGVAGAKVLELSSALNGHRLCENTVGLLEEKGLASWQSTGAVDKTGWVDQIRTVSTATGDYYIQESLHPNYWGQLALRSCVRQAYAGGAVRGGTCTLAGTGLVGGEPRMTLS